MTDPHQIYNERLGCHESFEQPLGWDPSDDDPPDDDEDYDPYEIDELKGDRALEMARESGRWGVDLSEG